VLARPCRACSDSTGSDDEAGTMVGSVPNRALIDSEAAIKHVNVAPLMFRERVWCCPGKSWG